MVRRCTLAVLIGGMIVGGAWRLYQPAQAGDQNTGSSAQEGSKKSPAQKKLALKAFMRKKLDYSQNVLEGLTTEDFELLEKGAKLLKTAGAAEEFMAYNDPLYAQFADEFRRIVEKMERAAKEKRLDGATLAFVDMTMSCVECHKHVRNVLVAQ